MSIVVNVLGDFCPIGRLNQDSTQFNENWLGDIGKNFHEADINVINLECPLTEHEGTILKSGPHLKASINSIKVLMDAGINVVTLANNHIMDYREGGLSDTISVLKDNGILCTGAGATLEIARIPLIIEKDGVKIAIVNFCEHEFSIADKDIPGAAPLDIVENYQDIMRAQKKADYVIVIIHGGIENYPYPTPRQVKTYRFFASLGVSAVIGHHSHCIQPYELCNGVPIFYSLGNFVFDEAGNPEAWYKGLLVSLIFDKARESLPTSFSVQSFSYFPQGKLHILSTGEENCNIFVESEALQKWDEFLSDKKRYRALLNNIQRSSLVRRLNRRIFMGFERKGLDIGSFNILRNESHYEAFLGQVQRFRSLQ